MAQTSQFLAEPEPSPARSPPLRATILREGKSKPSGEPCGRAGVVCAQRRGPQAAMRCAPEADANLVRQRHGTFGAPGRSTPTHSNDRAPHPGYSYAAIGLLKDNLIGSRPAATSARPGPHERDAPAPPAGDGNGGCGGAPAASPALALAAAGSGGTPPPPPYSAAGPGPAPPPSPTPPPPPHQLQPAAAHRLCTGDAAAAASGGRTGISKENALLRAELEVLRQHNADLTSRLRAAEAKLAAPLAAAGSGAPPPLSKAQWGDGGRLALEFESLRRRLADAEEHRRAARTEAGARARVARRGWQGRAARGAAGVCDGSSA